MDLDSNLASSTASSTDMLNLTNMDLDSIIISLVAITHNPG